MWPSTLLFAFNSAAHAQAVKLEPAKVPAEKQAAAYVDPNWKAPRTSWGDPQLEGVYQHRRHAQRSARPSRGARARAKSYARGVREARAVRCRGARSRAQHVVVFGNSVGSRTFGWSSQVIDPPNGRTAADTRDCGLRRVRGRPTAARTAPVRSTRSRICHLYDRCMTRGILGSSFAVVYGNGMRIAQSPSSVVISYEMLRRFARDSARRPRRMRSRTSSSSSATRAATGKATRSSSRRRNDGPRRASAATVSASRHSDSMKLTERLRRVDPEMIEYVVARRRPGARTRRRSPCG